MNTSDLSKVYLVRDLLDLPDEIWTDIPSYENQYQVSSLGRIKRLWKLQYSYFVGGIYINKKSIIMKGQNHKGYRRVSLVKDGMEIKKLVHDLVADAFIPNPNNYDTVDHISTIKTQNNFQNLRWTTRSENTLLAIEAGNGGNIYLPKFNELQAVSIFLDKRPQIEIAKEYNVDKSTISLIKRKKSYKRFTKNI